jgi:F-type H+-transporting ATPase subunit b
MLIDWFTVGAQGLNFIILVWLLKRFLYKPILKAIDAREKRIADELADAKSKQDEAAKERDDFQGKNKAFDEQRAALLAKANDEAKSEYTRLVGDARKEADGLKGKQEEALKESLAVLRKEITRRAGDEVLRIARKALADLATVSLEERMGEVFTRRLRELGGKAKQTLASAVASGPVVVQSAFEIPAEQRAAIQNALNETFSAAVRVRFEVGPEPVCGIELSANGEKVGWSVAEYLGSLERKLGALVDAGSAQAAPAAPKPEPMQTTAVEAHAMAS